MFALVSSTSIISPELILTNGISITTNLIKSIKYLSEISYNDNELSDLIFTSDILEDIGIIKNFIEDMYLKKNLCKTVKICIENLNQSLMNLEYNINSITSKIENHKNLWFKYFRSYNISEEKRLIPILMKQMYHRFNMLIEISKII